MDASIPASSDIRAELEGLGYSQVKELARLSGVPLTTLWKVRSGETTNPGIETVRKFLPHVDEAKACAFQDRRSHEDDHLWIAPKRRAEDNKPG